MSEIAKCQLCGEPMPEGEEMFNYHGYSGHCPKPPLKNSPSEKQEAEGLKEKPLDRFYALYLEGRKKEKAPQSYIDYFKASKFLLDEIDQTRKEVALKTLEEVEKSFEAEDYQCGKHKRFLSSLSILKKSLNER